jgi:hypothetical protein
MEETDNTPLQTSDPTAWTERFVAMLHSQRTSIREFLVAKQGQIEHSIAQLEELIARLSSETKEAQTASLDAASKAEAEADEQDLKRRYEMSLDDLRELKSQNAELQQQIGRAKSSVSGFAPGNIVAAGPLDWESIKRHILATLESDADENDPKGHAEKLKIEDVIRLTNNAIADKNREIEELRRQLKQAAEAKPAGAAAAAAAEQLFSADATILAERERLRQLQEQWKDKMRQAEIEVSLERAKLTRQRAEIEERLRVVESEQMQLPPPIAASKGGKPIQRWRVRLGLGDPE